MSSRRNKQGADFVVAALIVGSWLGYSVFAAQALPGSDLAQAPLNNQVQVPPAFIMSVDDSNSMTFERMFPGGDGRMQWNSGKSSFFSSAEKFHAVGAACQSNSADCYLYLFPHSGYNSSYSYGRAIPPLDEYGFARSHAYNAGYFDPKVVYEPWKNSDGTLWPNANPKSTRADPRDSTFGASYSTAYNVVYDLTSNRVRTDERFQFVAGMDIPNLSGTGNRYYNNNGWRTNAANVNNNAALAVDYFPATFYLPVSDPVPDGYKPSARRLAENACGPNCDLWRYQIKSANYTSSTHYDAAIKSFANWFQYHRDRLLSMVGAMSYAMSDVQNLRVGYFTINDRKDVTMRDISNDRAGLYTEMMKLQAGALTGKGGGTPNRSAVAHLGEQFKRQDAGAPVISQCQKNGGMLFTDGFTNSSDKPSGYGNVDGSLAAPFSDGFANTIADMAAAYYYSGQPGSKAPLRTGPGFPLGKVKAPDGCDAFAVGSVERKRLDCETNLHMNFYGVTLGATGSIYDVNMASTNDPFKNPPNWAAGGNPTTSDGGPTVDEIWHAALNARGEYISARTPADVTAAMRRVLQSVTAGKSPSGSIGMSGARVGSKSLSVIPTYEAKNSGTDWFSYLSGYKLAVDPMTGRAEQTLAWEASAKLPPAGSRSSKTYFSENGGVKQFSAGNITLDKLCSKPAGLYLGIARCTAAELTSLGADAGKAVRYILGDVSLEKRNGGEFRDRSSRLGDIVNSSPVISSPTDDYGYQSLTGPLGASYSNYLAAKAAGSRPYMVYVGANDGMLHAFNGGQNPDGTSNGLGGTEMFAYIPSTAVGHMGNLLFPYDPANKNDQKFAHRYYVDGPVAVSDTNDGSTWRTSLVGTAGAGGRSVFALDVSDPTSFSGGSRLWEISDLDPTLPAAVRDNIGFVLGAPVIVPIKTASGSPKWVTIFGNGYNSKSGRAALFMVELKAGVPSITMIEAVESGPDVPSGSNGLGNIVAVDLWTADPQQGGALKRRGSDGYADTVYAADQKGAVWKFDIRGTTVPATTTPIQQPLFTTKPHVESGKKFRQPITGGLTAAAGPMGGVTLFFGTGSFAFIGDPADKTIQTMYSINDTSDEIVTTLERSDLVIGGVAATGVSPTERTVTFPLITLANTVGWGVDLPAGERFVGNPRLVSGVIFMPTYAPTSEGGGCSTDGFNWLYGLNSISGRPGLQNARLGSPTGDAVSEGTAGLALDTGGTAPVKDVGVSVLPRQGPPALDPGIPPVAPPPFACWMQVSVAGLSTPVLLPYPCGRQSWRQVD